MSLPLDQRTARRPGCHTVGRSGWRHRIEQRLRGPSVDDLLGDRVGVPLVHIPGFADVATGMHAGTLLHHVYRLMGRGTKVR